MQDVVILQMFPHFKSNITWHTHGFSVLVIAWHRRCIVMHNVFLKVRPGHLRLLPSAVALPCRSAAWRWKDMRCIASQRHRVAASSFVPLLPAAVSPRLPFPARWRPTGSGWMVGRWSLGWRVGAYRSSRWSCWGRCERIRTEEPSPLGFPPPLSRLIPLRWRMDPTFLLSDSACLTVQAN